jgi:hypothetical protein
MRTSSLQMQMHECVCVCNRAASALSIYLSQASFSIGVSSGDEVLQIQCPNMLRPLLVWNVVVPVPPSADAALTVTVTVMVTVAQVHCMRSISGERRDRREQGSTDNTLSEKRREKREENAGQLYFGSWYSL